MRVSPETPLEERIVADPSWQAGAAWGTPRPGHPEGSVAAHITEVLANVDRLALDAGDRSRLRLVALVHDTFKYQVDEHRRRHGANHHAVLARRFAEHYLDDRELLTVIELHDEAYHCWRLGRHTGNWAKAEAQARALIDRLGTTLGLYLRFYQADNETGSKSQEPVTWFRKLVDG